MIELTPAEEQLIRKQREERALRERGAYGVGATLDEQQTSLLKQLDELNEQNRSGGYGPLPRNLDAETVALIRKIQAVGYAMKTAPHGDARRIAIPSRVAFEIIKAVRGDRVQLQAGVGDIKVPG